MEKSVKNRIITLSLREIKNSFKRFLSLLIISMLGVTVFVGIKATAPDMMNSIDKYYDDSTYYVDSVKIEDMAKDKDVPFGGRIAVKKKVEKSDKAINIHFIIGLVIAIFVVMSIGILKIKNSKGKYKR